MFTIIIISIVSFMYFCMQKETNKLCNADVNTATFIIDNINDRYTFEQFKDIIKCLPNDIRVNFFGFFRDLTTLDFLTKFANSLFFEIFKFDFCELYCFL